MYNYAILSLNPEGDTYEILDELKVRHKRLVGSYKGTIEESALISYKDYEDIRHIVKHKYKQETVLLLENTNRFGEYIASLEHLNTPEAIGDQEVSTIHSLDGIFRNVTGEEAKPYIQNGNYTYDQEQHKYFAVVDNR